jgi:hypothetical protein
MAMRDPGAPSRSAIWPLPRGRATTDGVIERREDACTDACWVSGSSRRPRSWRRQLSQVVAPARWSGSSRVRRQAGSCGSWTAPRGVAPGRRSLPGTSGDRPVPRGRLDLLDLPDLPGRPDSRARRASRGRPALEGPRVRRARRDRRGHQARASTPSPISRALRALGQTGRRARSTCRRALATSSSSTAPADRHHRRLRRRPHLHHRRHRHRRPRIS